MSQIRQFRGPIGVLLLTLAAGVVGYMVIERWSLLDSLFMTVITVTTVGYGEVHPLSPTGQIFTIVLSIIGVGAVLYTITTIFAWLLTVNWPEERRKRQMAHMLATLSDHFIVCGFGRVGRRVSEVLRREGVSVVVIDVNQASLVLAEAGGFLTVEGDAASDEVLKRAQIERARGLIAAVSPDSKRTLDGTSKALLLGSRC